MGDTQYVHIPYIFKKLRKLQIFRPRNTANIPEKKI